MRLHWTNQMEDLAQTLHVFPPFFGLFSPDYAAYKQCGPLVVLVEERGTVGVVAGFCKSSSSQNCSWCWTVWFMFFLKHLRMLVDTNLSVRFVHLLRTMTKPYLLRWAVEKCHTKFPHTRRKFKYSFIFLATMCYTCSQLQNRPVQTRQHRHIQCKGFPSWPSSSPGRVSINWLLWLECKKEKGHRFPPG